MTYEPINLTKKKPALKHGETFVFIRQDKDCPWPNEGSVSSILPENHMMVIKQITDTTAICEVVKQ